MITVTIAEAEAYHARRLHNDAWIDAEEVEKPIALDWAARLIDERFEFFVDYSLPESVIPDQIKNAISEFAMILLQKDPNSTPNEAKYTHMEMDKMIVKVNDAYAKSVSIIPDYIIDMIIPYCSKKKNKGYSNSVGGRRLSRC